MFYGVTPGVMAIAAVKLARLTDRKGRRLWVSPAVVALITAVIGAEVACLFVAAGLLIMVWDAPLSSLRRPSTAMFICASTL